MVHVTPPKIWSLVTSVGASRVVKLRFVAAVLKSTTRSLTVGFVRPACNERKKFIGIYYFVVNQNLAFFIQLGREIKVSHLTVSNCRNL